jgi:ATP-dependent RNA helicase DDX21
LIERIERIAKLKFKRTGVPQPTDIVRASARDIVISLKEVKDSVLHYFMDIAKEMIDEQSDPVKSLAKALAYISGNTERISQRSLLNSADGFITYILKAPVEFTSVGYIFNFLRNFAPEKVVAEIKGMKKFGQNIAAFDVP